MIPKTIVWLAVILIMSILKSINGNPITPKDVFKSQKFAITKDQPPNKFKKYDESINDIIECIYYNREPLRLLLKSVMLLKPFLNEVCEKNTNLPDLKSLNDGEILMIIDKVEYIMNKKFSDSLENSITNSVTKYDNSNKNLHNKRNNYPSKKPQYFFNHDCQPNNNTNYDSQNTKYKQNAFRFMIGCGDLPYYKKQIAENQNKNSTEIKESEFEDKIQSTNKQYQSATPIIDRAMMKDLISVVEGAYINPLKHSTQPSPKFSDKHPNDINPKERPGRGSSDVGVSNHITDSSNSTITQKEEDLITQPKDYDKPQENVTKIEESNHQTEKITKEAEKTEEGQIPGKKIESSQQTIKITAEINSNLSKAEHVNQQDEIQKTNEDNAKKDSEIKCIEPKITIPTTETKSINENNTDFNKKPIPMNRPPRKCYICAQPILSTGSKLKNTIYDHTYSQCPCMGNTLAIPVNCDEIPHQFITHTESDLPPEFHNGGQCNQYHHKNIFEEVRPHDWFPPTYQKSMKFCDSNCFQTPNSHYDHNYFASDHFEIM